MENCALLFMRSIKTDSLSTRKNRCPIAVELPLSVHHKTDTFYWGRARRAAPCALFIPDHDTLHNGSRCRVEELLTAAFCLPTVVSHSPHESLHFCESGGQHGKPPCANNSGSTNKRETAASKERPLLQTENQNWKINIIHLNLRIYSCWAACLLTIILVIIENVGKHPLKKLNVRKTP